MGKLTALPKSLSWIWGTLLSSPAGFKGPFQGGKQWEGRGNERKERTGEPPPSPK